MILILSNKWDVTVDFVVKRLQEANHPYIRLNTEDLPEKNVTTKIPEFSVVLEHQDKQIDLTKKVGAVWYRRPGKPFEFSDDEGTPSQGTIDYMEEQWGAWLQSLQSIPGISWINHPIANQKMEAKIAQLRLAADIGFNVPKTIVTNKKEVVKDFYKEQNGSMVAKALSSPIIQERNQEEFVFTTDLNNPPEDDESLKMCPTIFQESMVPKIDYRVTVVGDDVFPVKIIGEGDNKVPVDWRTEKENIKFIEEDLPKRIEKLCREYVKKAGLTFGAIDLVKVDNEFVFLEINPNGEWGWLQKPWGVPIAESISSLLIKQDEEG